MRYAAIAMILLGAVSVASAQTAPTTNPSAANVESLITQLGDPQWSARESAQQQLVAMGDAIVSRLQKVAKETSSDEVRQRAESAIAQIAEGQITGPSLITMHLKDAPAKDAFAELSRQSGTNLQTMPPEL